MIVYYLTVTGMKRTHYSTILLILLSTVSCKKEKITVIKEVPQVRSWSFDSSLFSSNKIVLTAHELNDSILVVTNGALITYINSNHLNESTQGAFINQSPSYGYLTAPRLTDEIGVTIVDSNNLKVFSITSPVSNFGSFKFQPSYSNSVNSTKGFPLPAFPQAGYPVINSKYILAPSEIDYQGEKAYFNLLKINLVQDLNGSDDQVTLASNKQLVLTPAAGTLGFANGDYFSAAHFGKFFLQYNSQFFRIDTVGNIKPFGYFPAGDDNGRVSQMFTIDNYLFAIGFAKFFVSQDEGETWSQFSDVLGTPYGSLIYFNVEKDLYATVQDQIYRVTLSGSTFNYQELDNDGLETSQITSVNKCGKYVFVSTLSGLYYRDSATLNTPKK